MYFDAAKAVRELGLPQTPDRERARAGDHLVPRQGLRAGAMSSGGSDPGRRSARSSPIGGPGANIAILAAQVEEVAPLLARIGAKFDGKDRAARYWSSDVDRWAIAVSGMGRRRARAAAAALLDRSGASQLMVIGVGGA